MSRTNQQNNLNTVISLPLDMQVAIYVTKKYTIRLIKDIETGQLIPHYYAENRFIEDRYYHAIRGLIKSELLDIFNDKSGNKLSADNLSMCDGLIRCFASETDFEKYEKNTGFLNTLTNNVLKNIMDFKDIVYKDADCDNEALLVNARNGIYDMESRELLAHTPDKLIRNVVNANFIYLYDKDEEVPSISINKWDKLSLFHKVVRDALWDKSKTDIENSKVVQSFMSILASLLIGNNEHKLVYIILGVPNSGKSTLLEVLLGIFGEYGTTFNNSAIMVSSRTSNDIRPDIIALKGKRLLAGSEANKKEKFDNALLKQLSGNDKVSARKPHKGDMITFNMSGKLLLVTNYCPMFSDLDDQAFLNRIVLIDFNNAPLEFDTHLKEKLLTSEARDQIFSYFATKASEIVTSKDIYIHERFHTNKQRILINQNSTVSLFCKAHIRPYEVYNVPANIMPRHPVSLLYSVMYIDFCKRLEVKPLTLEPFAKEFKELASLFPNSNLKKGKSNMFYIGLDVVGGNQQKYYDILKMAAFDRISMLDENLLE